MHKLILSIYLCFFAGTMAFTQTNRYWNALDGESSLAFDSSTYLRQVAPVNVYSPNFNNRGYEGSFHSSFNGDIMFFSGTYSINKMKGKSVIKNGHNILPSSLGGDFAVGGIYPWYGLCLQTNDNEWQYINTYYIDSLYYGTSNFPIGEFYFKKNLRSTYCNLGYCFDSLNNYPYGIYKTTVMRDSLNEPYIPVGMKNVKMDLPVNRLNFLDAKRTGDYNYRIVAARDPYPFTRDVKDKNASVYICNYNEIGMEILDSMMFKLVDFIPPDTYLSEGYSGNINLKAYLSRNRDILFVYILTGIYDRRYHSDLYNRSTLLQLNLDPLTGKILSKPSTIIDYVHQGFETYKLSGTRIEFGLWSQNIFSPNDSIIYCRYSEATFVKGTQTNELQKVLAWKFRSEPFSKAKAEYALNTLNYQASISVWPCNVNPFGGLTICKIDDSNSSKRLTTFIHYPDANNCMKGVPVSQVYVNDSLLWEFTSPGLLQYDYLRIKKSIRYSDCGAYTTLKNISDTSNGLSFFTWYVARDIKGNAWDTFKTKDLPLQFYKKPGKYIYKLHGISNKGSGYSEWYIDTINVKAFVPKPHLDFSAADSLICRYTGLQFYGNSTAIDTIFNRYLWNFGDGQTSVLKNPMHTYTSAPGRYNVSLFYSNGYCDTFLVKSNYIRVREAPKPGFNVSQQRGCAPFMSAIADTVTFNVKQKDYYFSDNGLWQNVNIYTPQFNHSFKANGTFKVVQRLTGFTGCVIQLDSIFIYIAKGLTNKDSAHIINSTVENKNALLWWQKQDAAIFYRLYKDGILYKHTTDTFFSESTAYTSDITYSVRGVDSCGNEARVGRVGKPIFLGGNIIGNNEASFIHFSPYLQWHGTNINYKIQVLQDGNWQVINNDKANASFTDKYFISHGKLEACYRIEAFETDRPDIISHSNELCIPFIPVLFIPTAFSPNGDTLNNIFNVITFGVKRYNIEVFNRWGEKIFSGNDNQGWDGGDAPAGVYLVIVNYATTEKINLSQRQTVTLLK